ncbi:hypothetical protein HDU79_009970 [Rhizoclosmatium sp. JEL0117]|nr:hypothetical protein HDU79_009970 [Rhizoclosmatium sp. JEL0117]
MFRGTKKVGGGRKKRTSIYKATEEIAAEEELTDSETVVFSAAKNPTEVFSQAAAKASTRRRTVEEPISCISCSAIIGVLELRTTQVSHRVLEAPITQPDVLEGVRDVFFDCLVSLYAVPGVLEGVDEDSGTAGLSSLARIHADVEGLWSSTVRDAIVSMFPKGLAGGKIYVTVAWIEKRNRNKGKGIVGASKKKKEEEEERIPWLLRLAMEGTVAPLKEKEEVGASSVLAALPILPEPSADEMNGDVVGVEKTYVSFAVSEWDRARGALFVLQMAPRSVYLPTMESYGDLLRRNIERVQADSRRDNAPPLEHIWCWTRNLSHSRLRSIPERLGFVPLEQYIREHPGVDRSTFVREGYKPLQEEGVSLHVTNVRKFMQMMMKKSKK